MRIGRRPAFRGTQHSVSYEAVAGAITRQKLLMTLHSATPRDLRREALEIGQICGVTH